MRQRIGKWLRDIGEWVLGPSLAQTVARNREIEERELRSLTAEELRERVLCERWGPRSIKTAEGDSIVTERPPVTPADIARYRRNQKTADEVWEKQSKDEQAARDQMLALVVADLANRLAKKANRDVPNRMDRDLAQRMAVKTACRHVRQNGTWNIKWMEMSNGIITGVCGTCMQEFNATDDPAHMQILYSDQKSLANMGHAGEHAHKGYMGEKI